MSMSRGLMRPPQASAGGGWYDFSQSMAVNQQYKFGPRDSHSLMVDQTLAHLFDTLTVECSGVLVQPQWKHFRHIQMLKNDRIRLSNGIWRSWHLQFQKKRKPLYCRFDIEPKLNHHKIQEAVVLEGKYWKRKVSAVATEYRKWRLHYHKKNKTRPVSSCLAEVRQKGREVLEELQRQSQLPQAMLIDQPKSLYLPNMDTDPLLYLMDTSSSLGDSGTTLGIGLQPNLDMLNPMLDDFLNRLEPMDTVALPRSLGGATLSTPGQAPIPTQPLATPNFGAQSATPQSLVYQPPYNPPTQMDPFTSSQQHNLSPTSFLNMTTAESGHDNLDLGQLPNFPMKAEPVLTDSRSTNQNSCMYSIPGYPQGSEQQNYASISSNNMAGTEDIYSIQATIQRKVDDMEGAFGVTATQLLPSQSTSPRPQAITPSTQGSFQFSGATTFTQASQYTSTHSRSLMSSPREHMMNQPPFVRVSSTGNLETAPLPSSRPPLERGKSEPIQRLREQVQKLSAENEKQIREIDKQKSLADRQYSELLHTVMQHAASGNASEQQKLALQSVLSDPSLVSIIRNALLTMSTPGGGGQGVQGGGGASSSAKMSLSELHRKTGSLKPEFTSPPNIVSPTDFAKVTGVSEFQSRLLVAAASQANQSSTTSTPLTPSPYTSYLSGSDSETTPTGAAALAQMRMKPARKLSSEEKVVYKEMRRQSHISAEQKRRGSIKHGFDHLQSLVVNLSAYPSGKVSKAVILEKTIDHIHHCHVARDEREHKMLALRQEIEELNSAIARCQEMLPASGVPVTRQRFEENRQRFREYVQRRTQQNYKFWIFSIILKQLFESYNSMVSTGSVDELCRTVLAWFEQNCALPALRPVVMDSLRELSQKTSILTDPSQVPRQLAQYAQQEMQLHRQEQEKARTTRFSSYS